MFNHILTWSLSWSYQLFLKGNFFKVTIKLILYLVKTHEPSKTSYRILIFNKWFISKSVLLRIPGISTHFKRQDFDHHLPHNYIRADFILQSFDLDKSRCLGMRICWFMQRMHFRSQSGVIPKSFAWPEIFFSALHICTGCSSSEIFAKFKLNDFQL